MIWLNQVNGANLIEQEYFEKCLEDFPFMSLNGIVMGSAYGGSLEAMGRAWKGIGTVYGFDTFIGHPTHLAIDPKDREATCMEHWYQKDVYGVDKLDYEYQRNELDGQGLDNVFLIKGEVQPDSCKDIPFINYAFLDMDILKSMENGYKAVKDKIVPNGYLLLHDVIGSLPSLYTWYDEIKASGEWEVVKEVPQSMIVVLKKNE